jgi:pilus assembly protein CpaB
MSVSVATAAAATFGVYRAIQTMPIRKVEVGTMPVVVATKSLHVGTRLTKDDLKVVAWPTRTEVPGAFSDPKELVDRGVVQTIGQNEPVTSAKVAIPGVGAGLPPVIPAGMRALSVRVNEVIGVAGFVLPGTRVDVLVTVREDGNEGSGRQDPMARTVVSNVEVLTAGTRYDQEQAKDGKPQQSTVVTLAVLPMDGERIALAAAEGKISLALRNPLDIDPTNTTGIRLAALMRGTGPEPVLDVKKQRMVPAKRVLPPPPSPPPPPDVGVPSVYKVETIRAAKRGEEVVR